MMELNLKELKEEASELNILNVQSPKGRSSMGISIVNSDNGKRLTMTKGLYDELGEPQNIGILIIQKRGLILLGENISNENSYAVSTTKKPIIYSANLAIGLSQTFNLDYSNRTSISFPCIKVDKEGEHPIAVIKMADMESEDD